MANKWVRKEPEHSKYLMIQVGLLMHTVFHGGHSIFPSMVVDEMIHMGYMRYDL